MAWITGLLTSGPARKALGLLLATITIALFLLNLRRAAPVNVPVGWQSAFPHRRKPMKSNAKCWTPPAAAPLIAMLWLTACAMAGSESKAPCPPVVEYTTADQARAADEVDALPDGALVAQLLSDYAVLRDQARVCR